MTSLGGGLHLCADGDPLGQFAIIQQSEGGWGLIVKEPLDREVRDRHALRVMATDGKFEASARVDVHVLDANDNSPQCEQVSAGLSSPTPSCMVDPDVTVVVLLPQPRYSEAVVENLPSGRFLLKVSAVDPDVGANGQVSYSLHGPNADQFHLDHRTGMTGPRSRPPTSTPPSLVSFLTSLGQKTRLTPVQLSTPTCVINGYCARSTLHSGGSGPGDAGGVQPGRESDGRRRSVVSGGHPADGPGRER